MSVSLEVNEATPVDNLVVHLDLAHTYIGDLIVTLISPAGLTPAHIKLHNRSGGATHNIKRTYDMLDTDGLASLKGKSLKGTWTLKIQDAEARDEGTLKQFGLELVFGETVPRMAASRVDRAKRRPTRVPRRTRASGRTVVR